MVKLEARVEGDNVVISKDSFEHLLNCLDNQKFVGEPPPCGDALAMDKKDYDKVQRDNQAAIDDFNRQCRELLHGMAEQVVPT